MPKFILAILIITILAWIGWALTLFYLPPQTWYSYTLFFGTLFVGLDGLITGLLFAANCFLQPQYDHLPAQAGRSPFRICLRHGTLVAGLLTGLGVMHAFRVLTTLNGFLLLTLMALGEMYFGSPPSPKSRHRSSS